MKLSAPVVGIAVTPNRKGYWLASANGSVYRFGDAPSYGPAAGRKLSAPVVGIAATPDGKGYWLVSSDGKVHNFGAARNVGNATSAVAIGV
jgi:myo-inositol-hexaphosphate 3-phosphohydrolase